MNKSVLIIICDFLLISILAMVEFNPSVEVETVDEAGLRDQAAEEMLELLQLSLEHEAAQRQEVESNLGATQEALEQTKDTLELTEQDLEKVSTSLQQTEAEKIRLEKTRETLTEDLEQAQVTLTLTQQQKEQLEQSLNENEEQARRLQAELRAQQELAARKDDDLALAQENLNRLESAQQLLQTQLQIRDTEKAMLEENLKTARTEVERARVEAEKAQLRTENLAAGVSELAATSSALKDEIRQTQPLSMNRIYRKFEDNRVFIRFRWTERALLGSNSRESALQSILLNTPDGVRAVFATGNTPLKMLSGKEETVNVAIKIGTKVYTVKDIGFLEEDRAIAAIKVSRKIVEESGIQVFIGSTNPLQFSSAVLVKDDQELYGEIPVRVPPGEPDYLEVERRLFNRLFGEFAPSQGDYVFSMTGELIGIMTRDDRARMVQDPVFVDFRKTAP